MKRWTNVLLFPLRGQLESVNYRWFPLKGTPPRGLGLWVFHDPRGGCNGALLDFGEFFSNGAFSVIGLQIATKIHLSTNSLTMGSHHLGNPSQKLQTSASLRENFHPSFMPSGIFLLNSITRNFCSACSASWNIPHTLRKNPLRTKIWSRNKILLVKFFTSVHGSRTATRYGQYFSSLDQSVTAENRNLCRFRRRWRSRCLYGIRYSQIDCCRLSALAAHSFFSQDSRGSTRSRLPLLPLVCR